MTKSGLNVDTNLPAAGTVKVGAVNFIYRLFLLTTAVMPLASLFWDVKFFWIKANWTPYPIFVIGACLIFFRRRIPTEVVVLVLSTLFYLLLAFLGGGEMDSIGRFLIAALPLTFYFLFERVSDSSHRYFWWIYGGLMLIPIYNSYMQYTGKMPFDEFDYINSERVGRMSGGYQKPHNLVAYLVPIFLLGFYLWKVRQRKLLGIIMVASVFIGVALIGYRTSLLAFLTIGISSFFMRTTRKLVYVYYKYFLNFFFPILAFIFFRVMLSTVGLWDKLRGRVPIWELHAWQFFDQDIFNIALGTQKVLIEDAHGDSSVYLIDEAHNNSFRTIIVFGLVGFFMYCVFMRKIVMHIKKKNYPAQFEFVLVSCFTYFIFYTITNEPLYYGSVLWPVLIWIFLAHSMPTQLKTSVN